MPVKRKKTAKKTVKKESFPKITPIYCPDNMSLEAWQTALRKQVAEKAMFNIAPMQKGQVFGDFEVKNPRTNYTYKVAFRGMNSNWNYCSCPDFKTNQLGTCKHVEAVRIFLESKRKRFPAEFIPAYTSVYLSYKGERTVRIRIGSDNADAFRELARNYFSEEGELNGDSYGRFSDFLREAKKINANFRCYNDAMEYIIDVRERNRRRQLIETKYPDGKLPGLLRAELYPYQEKGILFAARAGRSIIADEMGLGKTIQAIGASELMRCELGISSALIICPTSLKYQWKREIERFTGQTALVIEGNHLKRREQYGHSEFYKIVSYQSAANDIKILKTLRTDLLIMDEAQRLKNWNTQIAQAAKRILADYKIVLSGTPFENKLEELYAIAQYVDPYALGPYYKFMGDHRIASDTGKTTGYKNLNNIGNLLGNILIRRRKRDVNIQLPERMDKILFVPMTKEQRGMHDEFKLSVAQLVLKWQRMRFLSEADRQRLLLMLNQMRMVCDSTYILDQHSRFDTKIDELMNILNEVFESGDEKVVIFSQWERMTRLVAAELDKLGIGYEYLHGGVPSANRKALIDNFADDPSSRVFLSTDAGSTGLNLQTASLLINLDLPWNPAVLEQRIARIHRMGQKQNVQIINLVSIGTIEEQLLTTLNFKSSMFEGVLDDGADTVFLEESKFSKLMDTVETLTKDAPDANAGIPSVGKEEIEKKSEIPEPVQPPLPFEDENEMDEREELSATEQTDALETPTESSPQELISEGIRFISSFAKVLSSPEKTEEFVGALIEEDKETGKTSLRIDVPDKTTVVNLLNAFGKLLNNIK
ncbi:MAG: DEAD/DEAH box helicase [Dysgonamonadaceae bacterium]|jgi:superfamily II DNA or RNA helicase|nr:DEAD/DEAH box helicase [Dysgonamonadaceae bacterium]